MATVTFRSARGIVTEYQGIIEVLLLDSSNDNILAIIDSICICERGNSCGPFVMGNQEPEKPTIGAYGGTIVFNKSLPPIKTPSSNNQKVLIKWQLPTDSIHNIILDKVEWIKMGYRVSLEEAYNLDPTTFLVSAKNVVGL